MKADPGRAELLECKMEKMTKKVRHKLLLTPPYTARVHGAPLPLPPPASRRRAGISAWAGCRHRTDTLTQ